MDSLQEFLRSIDMGGFAAPATPPPQPAQAGIGDLLKMADANRAPILEDGNNSLPMILRRLLTGSNEPIFGEAPPPPLSLLPQKQLEEARAPGGPPGDLPPMARGQATAFPDGAPGALSPGGPGRAIGFGPGPNPSTTNPFTQAAPMPAGGPPGDLPPMARGRAGGAPPPGFMDGLMQKAGQIDWSKALLGALEGGMRGLGAGSNNPGLTALGGAYTKQSDLIRTREAEAKKLARSQAQEEFKNKLDVRKDSREERGADRADLTEMRRAMEAKQKNDLAVRKYLDAKLTAGGALSPEGQLNLYKVLSTRLSHVNKNGLMQPAEIEKYLAKEEETLLKKMGVTKQEAAPTAPPTVGTVVKGYRFKGGDWNNQANWEKV